MEIEDFIKDYLNDTDEGLKALVTFFLNLVMQFEANQQAGVEKYQRSRGCHKKREQFKDNSHKYWKTNAAENTILG
jgi:hypothetical protein